jgi:hypothetical protein
MRPFDYARTPPEAPVGFVVFAVRLVVVSMARIYAGEFGRRQRALAAKIAFNEVESSALVAP